MNLGWEKEGEFISRINWKDNTGLWKSFKYKGLFLPDDKREPFKVVKG